MALAGIAFIALFGWKLIPKRDTANLSDKAEEHYVAELTVPLGSDLIGKPLRDLDGAAGDCDVLIIGLIRKGNRLYGAAQNTTLREQDALVLEAAPNALDEFRTYLKLDFSDEKREALLKADGDGLSLSEVVVTETSRLNGKSVETVGLACAKARC